MFGYSAGSFVNRRPYSPTAQQFFARLATEPTPARKATYNTMISSLVAAGVWAKLDALYLFAAADATTALTNLIQPNYGATATNSPTFAADRGYTGASTKYIDSGFNPTTASSPKYVQDSACLGAWSRTTGQIAGALAGNGGGTFTYIEPRWTDDNSYTRLNNNNATGTASSDGSGLWVNSRTGAASFVEYRNGVSRGTQVFASAALQNFVITFLVAEAGAAYYATGECAGGFFGSGLSAGEVLATYNAMLAYMQAVGAA